MNGVLFIVATPIGNLEDITLRAIKILSCADIVVCEDSRRTGILLQKLQDTRYNNQTNSKSQILNSKPILKSKINNLKSAFVTIHEHSKDEKVDNLINELKAGKQVALVTDAGTPGIADPGGRVVKKAIDAGIEVVPIPGPSSLSAILSITGWQNEPVLFLGYLPKKKGRQTLLKVISNQRRDLLGGGELAHRSFGEGGRLPRGGGGAIYKTIVLFESPFRINKTINELCEYLGEDKQVVIGRELTKQYEEVYRGTLGEMAKIELKAKGEFVIAINLMH